MERKKLLNDEDVKLWVNSTSFQSLTDFISKLAKSVEGRENTWYLKPISSNIELLCDMLVNIRKIIDSYPVIHDTSTSRFGKIEFRDFYDELTKQSFQMIQELSSDFTKDQILELSNYLNESWGSRARIDYGSGHELNFICFLFGLTQYKFFNTDDFTNLVLKVFINYLEIMRILETNYWLEPAGSHGVWGLDDYHFLPFLFGAFQLSTHKHLKPNSIHNNEFVEMFEDRYLYFGCIAFINKIKTTASLRWHSPMLDDISSVKTWSKVAEGMMKMYKAEVLGNLPIMQHFFFGNFISYPEGISLPKPHNHNEADGGTSHQHTGWGDCCGISIPSAIAAMEMDKARHKMAPSR